MTASSMLGNCGNRAAPSMRASANTIVASLTSNRPFSISASNFSMKGDSRTWCMPARRRIRPRSGPEAFACNCSLSRDFRSATSPIASISVSPRLPSIFRMSGPSSRGFSVPESLMSPSPSSPSPSIRVRSSTSGPDAVNSNSGRLRSATSSTRPRADSVNVSSTASRSASKPFPASNASQVPNSPSISTLRPSSEPRSSRSR